MENLYPFNHEKLWLLETAYYTSKRSTYEYIVVKKKVPQFLYRAYVVMYVFVYAFSLQPTAFELSS